MTNLNELSPFARFSIELNGYDLRFDGVKIFKYEAWWAGFRDAEKIKNKQTILGCEIRVEKYL